MTMNRVAVTRRIAAPASALFQIVSSPAGHVEIDGSGMLEAAPDSRPLTAVGETFDIEMDRTPLNDIPGLVKYKVRNTVTRIVPDRLFEWNVGGTESPPVGHVYGWQLDPVGRAETDVTNYCDWSNLPADVYGRRPWPIVPVEMLERSVENLERIATRHQ
jgi:hypothetical protein